MNSDHPSDCSSPNPPAFSLMTSDTFNEGKLRIVDKFQLPMFSTPSPLHHLFPQNAKWQFIPVAFFFDSWYGIPGKAGLRWTRTVLLYSAYRHWNWNSSTEGSRVKWMKQSQKGYSQGHGTLEHGHVPRGPRHLVYHLIFRNTPWRAHHILTVTMTYLRVEFSLQR